MAKKKYYAVKKGKTPGIYLTWNDCKAQTDGYSGAIYKSFQSAEETENFVRGTAAAAGGNGAENGEETVQPDEDTAVAYVDGSYNVASTVVVSHFCMREKKRQWHKKEKTKNWRRCGTWLARSWDRSLRWNLLSNGGFGR